MRSRFTDIGDEGSNAIEAAVASSGSLTHLNLGAEQIIYVAN